jgi:hypothetical protein
MSERRKETHSSYALLSFSRSSRGGLGASLFGSSIKHNETIRMEVKPAAIERSLNTDWYYSTGKDYLEVEMSYSQFAEAITSMNMGSGIPVTLRYLDGKRMPDPNFENKRQQFENEVKEKMNVLGSKLSKLTVEAEDILTNKKSLNKGDREVILNQIKSLQQEIKSNIPFIQSMFNEQMDKTVNEAKGEIEAFTQNKIHSLGIEKLEDLKLLGQSKSE